ncbi:hypothetical protein HAX54_010331 [Datura stramonium]|uniref:Uncharacterized protein n=1 Tax=Datura stramonium TaxID=4076 RepID=A0ABS8THZ2_DATST|nr:hypothetical protein [Datura stramonium]
MSSTKTPLAKSSKKPKIQVQNTSNIKDKEVMKNEAKVSNERIARTMTPDEAIASATKNPALQRGLEMIRGAGYNKVQKRKTKAKDKTEVIAPKSLGMKNKGATSSSKRTLEDDHVIIPTTENANVGMLPENSL